MATKKHEKTQKIGRRIPQGTMARSPPSPSKLSRKYCTDTQKLHGHRYNTRWPAELAASARRAALFLNPVVEDLWRCRCGGQTFPACDAHTSLKGRRRTTPPRQEIARFLRLRFRLVVTSTGADASGRAPMYQRMNQEGCCKSLCDNGLRRRLPIHFASSKTMNNQSALEVRHA